MANKTNYSAYRGIFFKTTIITVLLLIIPQLIMAQGGKEKFDSRFWDDADRLVQSVDNGEMTSDEAVAEMEELRIQYKMEITREYKEMEKILAQIQNKTMTQDQAKEMLKEMEQKRNKEMSSKQTASKNGS